MLFTLDEAQQAVVQIAGEALDKSTMDGSSTMEDPGRIWQALGQAGLLSLAVPTRLGGEGLGALEIMVLLREIGRRGAAVPALATLALGVLPLAAWGTPEQQDQLLTDDSTVLTAGVREPADPMPTTPTTVATADLAVTGTKVGVPYAEQARRILVPVSLPAGRTGVALVDPRAPGVHLRRTHSSTGAPEYTVRCDGVVADGLLDLDGVTGLYRLARAGACALGTGAVAGALALTTAHVGTRQQFGRPLAAFQAVAQQISNVYVAARILELATLSACWRLGTGRAADADVDVATYWLTSQAPAALRTCHHLHGGLGLDISYPLHRYSTLIKDLVRFVGGSEHSLDRLGGHGAHRPD